MSTEKLQRAECISTHVNKKASQREGHGTCQAEKRGPECSNTDREEGQELPSVQKQASRKGRVEDPLASEKEKRKKKSRLHQSENSLAFQRTVKDKKVKRPLTGYTYSNLDKGLESKINSSYNSRGKR